MTNVSLAAEKPPKRAVLRSKQAILTWINAAEYTAFAAVDGGGDAVSQRLNRRKGTNDN
jgi:hypothetical protein